jgi:2',3'-cyclic-nucleotide 2'-phosphodiesterase (5'-nucleotidase family)
MYMRKLVVVALLTLALSHRLVVDNQRKPRLTLNEETFVVIATNDIHGAAYPTQLIRSDTKEKYTYGGLATMAGIIDIVKKEYGQDNVLYLDAGDHFQGGIEASKLVSNGMIINEFFNAEGVATTALGNHEFDFGPDFLNQYLKNSVSQFMAANLYSEADQPVTAFLPNTKRSQMFTLNNNFKVGVIGLITVDTPSTSSGFTQHLFPDYKFREYADIVYTEAKSLRANGAHAVLIMAHEGNSCPGQSMNLSTWKKTTNQTACPDGPMTHILDLLPNGTVDAIVQGHRHEIVHFYKNGVPIVGNTNGGFYFNLLYLTFNKLNRKLVDTAIEGPIPVCERIFTNLKRCPYVAPKDLAAAGQLTKWKFHSQDVAPSDRVQALFNEWLPLMKPYLEDIVENDVYLEVSKSKETELGNLVADLYFKAGQGNVDFSLVNPGSFRTTWNPGMLQYQHFYNMFPFENKLETFVVTGR